MHAARHQEGTETPLPICVIVGRYLVVNLDLFSIHHEAAITAQRALQDYATKKLTRADIKV